MKKSLVFLLTLVFCICLSITAFAQESNPQELQEVQRTKMVQHGQVPVLVDLFEMSPRTKYIHLIGVGLTIQDGVAYMTGECSTYEKYKISLNMELQQYANNKWGTIATYSGSDTSDYYWLSKSRTVSKDYSYRIKLTVTANSTETVTVYSSTEVSN